jgi:hypothetical protein
MSRGRWDRIIRAAMDGGPEVVHEYWKALFGESFVEEREAANRALAVLRDVGYYSPSILAEAEQRFPEGTFAGTWSVPSGFTTARGVLRSLGLQPRIAVRLVRPGTETKLQLSKRLETDLRFPWQLVIAANQYLKEHDGELLASRYTSVLGATAYEMTYKAPHVRSLRTGVRLERVEVAVPIHPQRTVRALLEAESVRPEAQAFEEFVHGLA